MTTRAFLALLAFIAVLGLAAGCGGDDEDGGNGGASGTITIDGSSTVGPFASRAA